MFGEIGEKVFLHCKAKSLTKSLFMKWVKNGDIIRTDTLRRDSEDEIFFTSNLLVNIVDETSFGEYQCIAENEAGVAKQNVVLKKRGREKQDFLFS